MAKTEPIEQSGVTENIPAQTQSESVGRGASPLIWVALGLALGLGGAATLRFPATPSRETHRSDSPGPANRPINTSPPPGAETRAAPAPISPSGPLAARLAPAAPLSSPALTHPAKAADGPMGFDQFAFPIPKPPAALPMPPSTLKGVIFRGPWPVPPPVTVTPVSPVSGPAGSFGPVVPSAPVKPASKAGGSPFLKSLLAQGLPKPPGVLPIPESTPTQSAVGTAHSVGPARIIFLNEYAADPVAAAKTLSEVAAKAGGTARFLGEETPDGKSQPKGVLFAIPTPALEDFLHRAVEAGELRDRTAWSGTVDARRAKLAEDANALVASLKRLREALLVTYLPDAAPVKDTDADIARAEAAATQLQLPEATDNLTIVRINFVAG